MKLLQAKAMMLDAVKKEHGSIYIPLIAQHQPSLRKSMANVNAHHNYPCASDVGQHCLQPSHGCCHNLLTLVLTALAIIIVVAAEKQVIVYRSNCHSHPLDQLLSAKAIAAATRNQAMPAKAIVVPIVTNAENQATAQQSNCHHCRRRQQKLGHCTPKQPIPPPPKLIASLSSNNGIFPWYT